MFNTILSLCEKHGFIRKSFFPKMKIEQLQLGPTGYLLLQNLKNEWFYNIVINKDLTVFPSDNESFDKTFEFAKTACMEGLPFGIAEVIQNKKFSSAEELIAYYTERMKEKDIDFDKLFAQEDQVKLKCTVFTSSRDSVQFFHQWQRQRRIWWRKFSPKPGRYTLTDIKTDPKNIQSVKIMAEYPWNSQLVETLTLFPTSKFIGQEKFKEGKKTVQAHSIISEIDMTTMFINAICDAHDEPEYKGHKRTLLRFHRKLAPYSISFAVAGVSSSVISELNDLALYLTKQLRSNHVSTLLLPSSSKLTLEAQWKHYDELGIPYNILLNEGTLRDGIAWLRSRDTTLKEQVHVTDLVTYVEQLFKNY